MTEGSVKVRLVPNDLSATVSLDLKNAAGDVISLKNVQVHETGVSSIYCQTD